MPKPAETSESLIWNNDGKLRMSAALAVLLAAHLVTTIMVVHFLARSDAVTPKFRTALRHDPPDTLPVAKNDKGHE